MRLISAIVNSACRLMENYGYARPEGPRLPADVSLLHIKSEAVCVPCSPPVSGYLRDISRTGLSLIVPSLRFGDRFLISHHRPLLGVRIELPGGAVEIQVAPVRYDKLHDARSERGYLIGGRITRLAEPDRARLVGHIRLLKSGKDMSLSAAHDAQSA